MKRTKLRDRLLPNYTKGEEIFNMVSHIVGGGFGILIATLCIIKAFLNYDAYQIVSAFIYGFSMITLYTMSSVYHGLVPVTAKKVFQIIDHCAVFILIAGFMLFFRRKVKAKLTVEISADPEDIVKRLEDMVKHIDTLLAKEKQSQKIHQQLMDSAINADEAQLFSYLMEAKLSADADFALEQLDEVERYLAKQDVLLVKYIKGNEKYFDFLEGEETKTIRPALVRGGEMLAKGLAQLKYGEKL